MFRGFWYDETSSLRLWSELFHANGFISLNVSASFYTMSLILLSRWEQDSRFEVGQMPKFLPSITLWASSPGLLSIPLPFCAARIFLYPKQSQASQRIHQLLILVGRFLCSFHVTLSHSSLYFRFLSELYYDLENVRNAWRVVLDGLMKAAAWSSLEFTRSTFEKGFFAE
jgi:hypothetical protein